MSMAIVKMKKITLAASVGSKDEILNVLLENGSVDIVDLKDADASLGEAGCFKDPPALREAEEEYNKIGLVCGFLKKYSNVKENLFTKKEILTLKEFKEAGSNAKWKEIYGKCASISKAMDENRSERTAAANKIGSYFGWENMDTDLSQLDSLRMTVYFIGTINARYIDELKTEVSTASDDAIVIEVSSRQKKINLFVLAHKDETGKISEILKKYGFAKTGIDLDMAPKEKIEYLESRVKELDRQYEDLAGQAFDLASNLKDMEKVYDFMASKLEKEKTISKLARTRETFVLEGWVPGCKADRIKSILKHKYPDALVILEEPAEDDAPPIQLKNNAFVEPFEVITSLYSLPLNDEIDPTPVLTPFFILFFGMMMADAGYGLIMGIVAALMLKYTNIEGSMRKIVKVLLYCSPPTVIFGLLYGSFFGGIIPLKPLWVSPVDNTMEVLIVSIALGLIHIFTGLGVKAYELIKSGHILDAVYDVFFWYGLIIGLIWMLLGGGQAAKIISAASAVGLLLTQGRSNKTIMGKFFGGLYGLYGITSYLGDALSYSRLLALGLASGLIGWAFDLLINMLGSGVAAIVGGTLIFLVGHTFNLLVGGLGTFVHTCRLEYLEFFGKFYQGGGKAFNPLKINTKFIKLDTEK